MDKETGGQSSGERQRRTAAEIARKKVLEAYGADPGNYVKSNEHPKADAEEWKKYHSAWQDYYQRYYGDYYNQVARDYVEQEKLKYERTQAKSGGDIEAIEREMRAEVETHGIREKIRANATEHARKVRRSKHFAPLAIGVVVILAGVFLQYNQMVFANVAAYVTPGGGTVSGITAIDPNVAAEVGPESLLIIPKLNVVVPIVFGSANDVAAMNRAMGNGVAHFAVPGASAMPGEIGNFVISGHSAGNVYQVSDYKFVFSGLERLNERDLIYVNYDSVRYTYSLTSKQVVDPTNVAALTEATDKPILTLITCTPLGTSRYRLLVFAEQISPSPDGAGTMEPMPDDGGASKMPSNDPAPMEQLWNWLTGRA
jgi:sortase A